MAQTEELKVRTIERDLSARAAETASRQHSITKIAKLEAECRKLRAQSQNSLSVSEHKSTVASTSCVESLRDSHSDYTDQLITLDIENRKLNIGDMRECQPDCRDSWATALMVELDRFKTGKEVQSRSFPSSSAEIELMDDFLDIERQVTFEQNDAGGGFSVNSEPPSDLPNVDDELMDELTMMAYRTVDVEQRIERVEAEKKVLEMAFTETQICLGKSQAQLAEEQMKLEKFEMELHEANESKLRLELELNEARAEFQRMSTQIRSLGSQLDKEKALAVELLSKCRFLENELEKWKQQIEFRQNALTDTETKIKQWVLKNWQNA